MSIDAIQDQCPKCGKFQPKEADGYYANEIYPDGTESDHVRVFCNEKHYEQYAASQRASALPDMPTGGTS